MELNFVPSLKMPLFNLVNGAASSKAQVPTVAHELEEPTCGPVWQRVACNKWIIGTELCNRGSG